MSSTGDNCPFLFLFPLVSVRERERRERDLVFASAARVRAYGGRFCRAR